ACLAPASRPRRPPGPATGGHPGEKTRAAAPGRLDGCARRPRSRLRAGRPCLAGAKQEPAPPDPLIGRHGRHRRRAAVPPGPGRGRTAGVHLAARGGRDSFPPVRLNEKPTFPCEVLLMPRALCLALTLVVLPPGYASADAPDLGANAALSYWQAF